MTDAHAKITFSSLYSFAAIYKCVQLNCDFGASSTSLLSTYLLQNNIDICFSQDIYCSERGLSTKKSPAPINGFNLFFKPNLEEHTKVAIYVSKRINASVISQASNPYCITCNITSSSGNNIFISSIYSPPSDLSPLSRLKCIFENLSSSDLSKLIICADLNAHSDLWSNASKTDLKGEEVEGALFQNNMLVVNNPDSPPTFESSRGRSWIDLTICGHQVFDKLTNWKVNEEETLSLHKMIEFDIETDLQVDPPVRYNYESTN